MYAYIKDDSNSERLTTVNYLRIIWWSPFINGRRRYMAEILQIRRKTLYNQSINVTSISFDIGLSYLAQRVITMRQCVAYIIDPDTTLTFDHQGQIYRVFDMVYCLGYSLISFDLFKQYFYDVELCMTLIFDLYVGGGDILSEF